MAFIDELTLHIGAGKGGNGIVSWLHAKGKEFAGPAGGDGGKGGDVYIRAVRDLGFLINYKNITEVFAENGYPGMSNSKHGRNGKDYILDVPVGSRVTNRFTGEVFDMTQEGQQELILQGGRGGLGNEHFKSSRNVSPQESTKGSIGEEADFYIELRLIADFGLVGFPNAGKSSFLNIVTKARSKVGDYSFTTLEPHLGSMYGYIIADIPGLIEGASENKGLGYTFLRHITRTRVLIHCVPADNPDYKKDYDIIKKELAAYDPGLASKPEIVLITKTDMVTEDVVAEEVAYFEKQKKHVLTVSVLDDSAAKKTQDALIAFIRDLNN